MIWQGVVCIHNALTEDALLPTPLGNLSSRLVIVRHLAISPASSTTIYILKPNAGRLEDLQTRIFESRLIEMSSIQKQLAVLGVDVEWSFV